MSLRSLRPDGSEPWEPGREVPPTIRRSRPVQFVLKLIIHVASLRTTEKKTCQYFRSLPSLAGVLHEPLFSHCSLRPTGPR